MPIYAYRCTACGHAQDVLQKMSDPVLTECPACGASAYAKQVTAAGFQLKGSGWYVTDFRGGNNAAAAKKDGDAAPGKAGDKPSDGAAAPAPASKGTDSAAPAPAPAAPAASGPSPSPASGS
jgi:putative FmdB family regulatory protein